MPTPPPIRVGILGLGRSGYGIHAQAFRHLKDLYHLVALHDPLPDRLQTTAKEFNARPHATLESFLADTGVELAVVASPNKFHTQHALAALKADKHTLCEKPFGTSVADVDHMIAAAKAHGKILQPFQQRRYEPDFLKVREVIHSGVLGDIQFIRTCWHSFKRRWDWQTMQSMSAGELFNNGPHPIDHALTLFDDNDGTNETALPTIYCERRKCLTAGDAEDHVKIILSAPDRPTIEIEISSIFPYAQDRWLVCGTNGGLRGNATTLEWKYVNWNDLPPRPLDPTPTPDRSYNSEKLPWQTGSWKQDSAADTGAGAPPAQQPILDLYKDLHATLRQNKPQIITPQSVRRRVAVLERCAAQAPVRQ